MLADEVSSNMPSNFHESQWEKAWTLFVLARMKIFLWKCAVGILPTKTTLLKKHVQMQDVVCDLCREEEETIFHAIVSCSCARDVWELYLAEGWPLSITSLDQW